MKRLIYASLLYFCFLLIFPLQTLAQESDETKEEILTAKIISIDKRIEFLRYEKKYQQQILNVELLEGSQKGDVIKLSTTPTPTAAFTGYKVGDKLLVGYQKEGESYYLVDVARENPMLLLTGVFILLTLFIARKKGAQSLIALFLSFIIIFIIIIPFFASSMHPLLAITLSICIILPITFYISHGVSRKITLAMVSAAITLTLTIILAFLFLTALNITGLGITELETLLLTTETPLNVTTLLLAGVAIGAVGIVDDITITQLSLIEKLIHVSKNLSSRELYTKAMQVGKDHIASVVNTLVLVYVGGSLPLLLLLTKYPRPLEVRLNSEMVALEIVTVLTTTIGIILAVPLTTIIGVKYKNYWLNVMKK